MPMKLLLFIFFSKSSALFTATELNDSIGTAIKYS